MSAQIRILREDEYARWDEFVMSTSTGCIYSTAQYLDALCSSAGGNFSVVAVESGETFQAGIALYETNSRWGKLISPRTLLPYNGFVLASSNTSYPSRRESAVHASQRHLSGYLESCSILNMTIRCRPPFYDVRTFVDRGWIARPTYTYVVPLGDLENQWGLVDRKIKSQIKKAQKMGYTIHESKDFESFFLHHHLAHEEKGFPVYMPRNNFQSFYETLNNRSLARIFQVISATGETVASQLVLCDATATCHIVAAGSDRKHDSDGVNALLRWGSFERLSAHGYSIVDLTDASLNSVSRFKSKFGAELRLSLALSRKGGPPLRRLGMDLESRLRSWFNR